MFLRDKGSMIFATTYISLNGVHTTKFRKSGAATRFRKGEAREKSSCKACKANKEENLKKRHI